jgi:hypothetical protein
MQELDATRSTIQSGKRKRKAFLLDNNDSSSLHRLFRSFVGSFVLLRRAMGAACDCVQRATSTSVLPTGSTPLYTTTYHETLTSPSIFIFSVECRARLQKPLENNDDQNDLLLPLAASSLREKYYARYAPARLFRTNDDIFFLCDRSPCAPLPLRQFNATCIEK